MLPTRLAICEIQGLQPNKESFNVVCRYGNFEVPFFSYSRSDLFGNAMSRCMSALSRTTVSTCFNSSRNDQRTFQQYQQYLPSLGIFFGFCPYYLKINSLLLRFGGSLRSKQLAVSKVSNFSIPYLCISECRFHCSSKLYLEWMLYILFISIVVDCSGHDRQTVPKIHQTKGALESQRSGTATR